MGSETLNPEQNTPSSSEDQTPGPFVSERRHPDYNNDGGVKGIGERRRSGFKEAPFRSLWGVDFFFTKTKTRAFNVESPVAACAPPTIYSV